jgi:hypothetical protein
MCYKKISVSISLAIALLGCGGGGDNAGGQSEGKTDPQAAAKFTADNYTKYTRETLSALNSVTSSGSSIASGVESSQSGLAIREGVKAVLKNFRGKGAGLPQIATGVVLEESEPCQSGGSIKYENHDLNGNDDVDIGEFTKMIYQQCRVTVGGVLYSMTGTLVATVRDFFYNQNTDEYDFINVKIDYLEFAVQSDLMSSVSNGAVDLAIDSGVSTQFEMTVEGSLSSSVRFGDSSASRWVYLNGFEIDGRITQSGATSLSYLGDATNQSIGSGVLRISTQSPMAYGADLFYPTSGVVLITAEGGGKVKVEANGQSARVSLDENDDGTYERVSNIPWSEISFR